LKPCREAGGGEILASTTRWVCIVIWIDRRKPKAVHAEKLLKTALVGDLAIEQPGRRSTLIPVVEAADNDRNGRFAISKFDDGTGAKVANAV
jgi:hypothetical protein